jgi:hypothetical protein
MEEILLQLLRNELTITWEDDETNMRLERIILNAIPTMNYKLGATIDYSIDGIEQNLFINYCVYVYNGCANEFDVNYFNEIMQVRYKYEVMDSEN